MESLKRILLVDDDEVSLFLTQRILNKANIEVELLTACHGLEALEILKAVCQRAQCPELILLDINMPVMNGFEFLDELQKSASLSCTAYKIVVLSSSTHYMDLVKANHYPVIDYIEKPLTLEKITRFL